jgi:dienelactone hydrolase
MCRNNSVCWSISATDVSPSNGWTMRTLALCLLLLPAVSRAGTPADTTILRSSLIIAASPGFSDNIARKDPIEAAFICGTWHAPRAGESIAYNDTAQGTWERADADSAGWFEHPSLAGGYVYATVDADSPTTVLLAAMGNSFVYVNGIPRSGNPYGAKDTYEPWEPRFDYSLLPVRLRKGKNEFLFHCSRGRFKALLIRPPRVVFCSTKDLTVPDFVSGGTLDSPGALLLVNGTDRVLRGYALEFSMPGAAATSTPCPAVQPYSVRKIPFRLKGEPDGPPRPLTGCLRLHTATGEIVDSTSVPLRIVSPADARRETFTSGIDGSVQYYAVTPPSSGVTPVALFLSLHGAAVEAINQAQSYAPKPWGVIVAPTNRRPYGFNWEDWGRSDALEVLAIARRRFSVDESRVYLTGHSMGGHGTYHIGTLFPDRFAAIGPSAGWLSFWSYRTRERYVNPSPMRSMLMRATLPSETLTMAENLRRCGIYILHGSDDDNVLVGESRTMAAHLQTLQCDVVYHEEPGAGHWWDRSDAPGADCTDWPPMFDFFARHARPTPARIRRVTFATPDPGVSSSCDWIGIEAQVTPCALSRIDCLFDPGLNRVAGTTLNVGRLSIDIAPLAAGASFTVDLDGHRLTGLRPSQDGKLWLYRDSDSWRQGGPPPASLKSPARSGTFKDAFRNNVLFVYGTAGTAAENGWAREKAGFDAERFWYQGNGSVDIIPDTEFDPASGTDRNVILYGNAETNTAWTPLLGNAPVRVTRGRITAGRKSVSGDDLCCLMIRPRPGSSTASVGVVAGTGPSGMRLTDRLPYLLPGVAFPDLLIARAVLRTEGESGLEAAGFFGVDWSLEGGEVVWK